MATRKHENREVMWMRANALTTASEYQRPLTMRKVRSIIKNFDPDAFGVLEVSAREDGTFVIMDGQHRHKAYLEMGWDDQLLPVIVHHGLTLQQEARVFRIRGRETTPIGAMQLYKTELVEGHPEALAMQAVVENLGLQIESGNNVGNIQAVSAVRYVYTRSGALNLGLTIRILRDAWGRESHNFHADIIKGLALFLHRYHGLVDTKALVKTLQTKDVHQLRAAVRSRTQFVSLSAPTGVALVLVDLYNRRRVKKLPQWLDVPESYVWNTHTDLLNRGYGSTPNPVPTED